MTDFVVGGRYNWKGQPERLTYMGTNRDGSGLWHQFAKVDAPGAVWCEVRATELHNFEATPPTPPPPAPDAELIAALRFVPECANLPMCGKAANRLEELTQVMAKEPTEWTEPLDMAIAQDAQIAALTAELARVTADKDAHAEQSDRRADEIVAAWHRAESAERQLAQAMRVLPAIEQGLDVEPASQWETGFQAACRSNAAALRAALADMDKGQG